MTFLIFIPRSAAQIKSKQFHHLHRTSLILTEHSLPRKRRAKRHHTMLTSFPHFTFPVRNHTQLPGLVFKSLPPPKKEDYQTSKTEKTMKKIPKSNPTCKQILVLILGVNRNPRKLKLAFGAIQTQPSPEMPQILLGFWLFWAVSKASPGSFLIEKLTIFPNFILPATNYSDLWEGNQKLCCQNDTWAGQKSTGTAWLCPAPPPFSPKNQQKDCKSASRAAPLLPEHSQINPTGNTPALFQQVLGLWEALLWQAAGLQGFQNSHPSRNCLPKRDLSSVGSSHPSCTPFNQVSAPPTQPWLLLSLPHTSQHSCNSARTVISLLLWYFFSF